MNHPRLSLSSFRINGGSGGEEMVVMVAKIGGLTKVVWCGVKIKKEKLNRFRPKRI